jgi:hypothetical protein
MELTADEDPALEPPESDFDEIFLALRPPKPVILKDLPRSIGEPTWLAESRRRITECAEPLTAPFPGVSEKILESLEEAESTRGSLKQVLAKVMTIVHNAAHKTRHQYVVKLFNSNNDEEQSDRECGSGDPSELLTVLECICRAMVLEE